MRHIDYRHHATRCGSHLHRIATRARANNNDETHRLAVRRIVVHELVARS
jgi:hypothetical protein